MNNNKQIRLFLEENLNKFTSIKLEVISVTSVTSLLCNDPGNEMLYMVHLAPVNEEESYTEHEPVIHIRALSNAMQELDIAKGDHCLTIENYIGMNTTLLLPITLLS